MKIDVKFPNKIILMTNDKQKVISFIKEFFKQAWLDHDIPSDMRKVKDPKKLTLDMLPKDFQLSKIEEIANNFKDNSLNSIKYPKIGVVSVNIDILISPKTKLCQEYKIMIDKFEYEKDGHNLMSVINKTIANI